MDNRATSRNTNANSSLPNGNPAADADEPPPPPRTLRTVYQRRSNEEQALRRSAIAELSRRASAPREDRLYCLAEEQEDMCGDAAISSTATPRKPSAAAGDAGRYDRSEQPVAPAVAGSHFRRSTPHQAADGPLRFSSAFEGGNLLCAKLVCPVLGKSSGGGGSSSSTALANSSTDAPTAGSTNALEEPEYELFTDGDTQSSTGHTQWFFFSVTSMGYRGVVHFRIANMRKKRSLYQSGLQPHVYSVRRNTGWEPFACQQVSYSLNSHIQRPKGCSEGVRGDQSSLAFSYRIEYEDDEVFFASYEPYTYSMLNCFLARLHRHPEARRHFRCLELCRSVGQLPVPLLVISEGIGARGATEAASEPFSGSRGDDERDCGAAARFRPPGLPGVERQPTARPALSIIARQHPGEVVGSWAVQGVLKFLLGPSQAAQKLREAYVIHVVPMVNVDGVVYGNSRCTLAGVDPNRVWHDPNPIINPIVHALKNHLRSLAQGLTCFGALSAGMACKGLELFLDLHGHSAKFGGFFYGCSPTAPISNALFPKLCAMASHDILFEQCHWRCSKSHRRTARYVVNRQLGVKFAYTLECSFLAARPLGSPEVVMDEVFTPRRVEWMGIAVGRTVTSFLNLPIDPLHHLEHYARLASKRSDGGRGPDSFCSCRATDFLPDVSCPKVLAKVPWIALPALEATTSATVLEELVEMYGDQVPSASNPHQDGGSDASGDSDGDGLEEAGGAEQEEGQRGKDSSSNRAPGSVPARSKRGTREERCAATAGSSQGQQNTAGSSRGGGKPPSGSSTSGSNGNSGAMQTSPSGKAAATVPPRLSSGRLRGAAASMANRRAASVELRSSAAASSNTSATPLQSQVVLDSDRSAPSSTRTQHRSTTAAPVIAAEDLQAAEGPQALFVWTDDWSRTPGVLAARNESPGGRGGQPIRQQVSQIESPPSSTGSGQPKLVPLDSPGPGGCPPRRPTGASSHASSSSKADTNPTGGVGRGAGGVAFPSAFGNARQRGSSPARGERAVATPVPPPLPTGNSHIVTPPNGPSATPPAGSHSASRGSGRSHGNGGGSPMGGSPASTKGSLLSDASPVSPPVGPRGIRPRHDCRISGDSASQAQRQARSSPPPAKLPSPTPAQGGVELRAASLRDRAAMHGVSAGVAAPTLGGANIVLAVGPGCSRSMPLPATGPETAVSERTRAVVRSLAWMRKPVAGAARS